MELKISKTDDGISIDLSEAYLKHCFEIDADEEFEIKDFETYKDFLITIMKEESDPHTGADAIAVMLTELNNIAMENLYEDSGTVECELE